MKTLKVPSYLQWIIITGGFFLLLMSLLRFCLVYTASNYNGFSGLLSSFTLGFRYDLRMVSIVGLLIFILGLIKPLHPFHTKRGKIISNTLWIIFALLLCLFYSVDFAHYNYLGQRLNGSVLNYLDDAMTSINMIWQTYPVIKIVLSLLAGMAILSLVVRSTYRHVSKNSLYTTEKAGRIGWSIVVFLLLAVGIFGRVGQYPLRWSDAFSQNSDYKAQIALNPFQSFFSSLSYRTVTYDINKVKHYYPWMAAELGVTKFDSSRVNFERVIEGVPSASGKPNIILVICESFSAYKSTMAGNPLNTTPYFSQMTKDGIYFNRTFTPSYGTARGLWATLTGIPDVQMVKTASRNPSAVDQHIIMNDFKGYEKFYFLGGSASWANIRGLLTNNIGNLHLYEEGDYKAAKIDVWGISDKNLFLEANKVLAKQQSPFFAVIQTSDNHRPYTIPEEDAKVFQIKNVPGDTLGKYGFSSIEEYNAFRYTDFSYETFMEAAKKEKYFNNTVFVFIGDHGIVGNAENILPKAFTEQNLTFEHVPLLFYSPQLLKPANYSFPVSQVDVLPSVAGLVKISYRNSTLGRDIINCTDTVHPAFIIDVDRRRMGIIYNSAYYNSNLDGSDEQIASIVNNDKMTISDSLRKIYKPMTEAYYETSRYLLFHNKNK
ncbi:MAG TPA: sulfatase-like hydrolase/transferase [Segetibacter sp.]|nr:sulfatase-like hydrolase/transferase [Segetibacter sp.]